MEDRIKEILMNLGADICGIANAERFTNAPLGFRPTDIYEDCKSVIVFAKCMPKGLAYIIQEFYILRQQIQILMR